MPAALPASASPTAAPPAPIPSSAAASPSATADPSRAAAEVEGQVAAQLAGRRTHAAVAVIDRLSGVALTVNGSTRFRTASIVKVDILAALLLLHQRAAPR